MGKTLCKLWIHQCTGTSSLVGYITDKDEDLDLEDALGLN